MYCPGIFNGRIRAAFGNADCRGSAFRRFVPSGIGGRVYQGAPRVPGVCSGTGFKLSGITSEFDGDLARRDGLPDCYGVPIPAKLAEPPTSVFRLVYIGRLVEEQKRVSDLATALCAVAQRIPNLEAWIIGEGSAHNAVEDIIRKKGNGCVRLLGRVDNTNIYDLLAQCHGLVLLSDYEGLPVAMLEAMATGVVPICLDVRSGIREALEHGVNGLIVKDRADDFFSAVKALGDPGKWQKLSLAARETVRQRYSIEECARQWVGLLRKLNSARATRANFSAPKVLRLPPRNPKFGHQDMRLSLKTRLRNYVRSVPALHRMTKAALSVWH